MSIKYDMIMLFYFYGLSIIYFLMKYNLLCLMTSTKKHCVGRGKHYLDVKVVNANLLCGKGDRTPTCLLFSFSRPEATGLELVCQ